MNPLLLSAIFAAAFFTQSTAGFGSALIAMPLLVDGLGVQVAAPLFALTTFVVQCVLIIRYRQALNLRAIARLAAASLVGIPLGIQVVKYADERLILMLLGLVVTGYALYGLLNFHVPEIKHPRWAYVFGFLGGVLSGAYNVGGPPVVIYGTGSRWEPAEFKGNLQSIGQFNTVIVLGAHVLAGNFAPVVWENFLIAIPGLALGTVIGLCLDRHINPVLFHKIVLVVLVFLGLKLFF